MQKAELLVLSNYYWNSEVTSARVNNEPDKLTILADFTPAEELVNIFYSTPKKDVKLFDLPAPIAPFSADGESLSTLEDILQEDLNAVCSISGNQLKTLDSAEMRVPQTQCYHLLAKDCSQEERWSVMFASAGIPSSDAKVCLNFSTKRFFKKNILFILLMPTQQLLDQQNNQQCCVNNLRFVHQKYQFAFHLIVRVFIMCRV